MIDLKVKDLIDSPDIKSRFIGYMEEKGLPDPFSMGTLITGAGFIEQLIKNKHKHLAKRVFKLTTGSFVADLTITGYLFGAIISLQQAFNEAGYRSRELTTLTGLGVACGLSLSEIDDIAHYAQSKGWL